MAIYTSRFSNPVLRQECYTAVRISLGAPRWKLGYSLDGAIKDLMPVGLLGKYDEDMEGFKKEYFKRLDCIGVDKIKRQLQPLEHKGNDIVLLCYEDIRKGPNDWCHRVMFAEWWKLRTGELIEELPDSTTVPTPKIIKGISNTCQVDTPAGSTYEQVQLSI